MHRIALTAAALGLAACATTPSGGTISAQDVNCGAGVIGGALIGGLAGNQIGKGQGRDIATAAGATIGGLYGATRPRVPARRLRPRAAGAGRLRPPRQAGLPIAREPALARRPYNRRLFSSRPRQS